MAWLGVPCAQWIFLSRGSTGRSRVRPRGKKLLKNVAKTNRLVRRLCYLFLGKIYLDERFLMLAACTTWHWTLNVLALPNIAKARVLQNQRRVLVYRAAIKLFAPFLQAVGGEAVSAACISSPFCAKAGSIQRINDWRFVIDVLIVDCRRLSNGIKPRSTFFRLGCWEPTHSSMDAVVGTFQ